MGRAKSQLRYVGYWPDGSALMNHPAELTDAARRTAATAIEQLSKLGVSATLDKLGRAHFNATKIPSRDARLMIERHADLIESYLVERAKQECGR
jgi:hypothetical protein